MISEQDIVNLRSTGLILFLSFSLALMLVGVLISKWHSAGRSGKKEDRGKGLPLSSYAITSRIMITVGAIFTLLSLMFLAVNLAGLL